MIGIGGMLMKPKRGNNYKVVQPMVHKVDRSRFVHMIDTQGTKTFVNYDYLEDSYSIGYYLNQMI